MLLACRDRRPCALDGPILSERSISAEHFQTASKERYGQPNPSQGIEMNDKPTVLIASSDLAVAAKLEAIKALHDLEGWGFVFLLEGSVHGEPSIAP